MSKRDPNQDRIPGMCRQGNECVADLRSQDVPRQKAIEECCRRGGHHPGDETSPDRHQRRQSRRNRS